MGSIVVLFEMEPGEALRPDSLGPPVLAVHAAGADPDVPEDPLPKTLCGLDTGLMDHANYRPARPGDPWYPPGLAEVRCRECERALRSS
ncbi:hypothetical protein [Kitasatospora brasiliensis]|uniref:hypothetical protein n=1 Tax=Kitasatospora brasiliensis TaxID=3058040 RepID=UPI0029318DDF|nr:hypothetical protein [Kitasatospora sp. K002]